MIRGSMLALAIATTAAGCGPSKAPDLSGEWDGYSSEWGKVVLRGDRGTYTDTYGSGPGTLMLWSVGSRAYEGTWKETDAHGGQLKFSVSEDGHAITGTYVTWKTSPHRPGHQGRVQWTRVLPAEEE